MAAVTHCCGAGSIRFNPWPGNFHIAQAQPGGKKKKRKGKKIEAVANRPVGLTKHCRAVKITAQLISHHFPGTRGNTYKARLTSGNDKLTLPHPLVVE